MTQSTEICTEMEEDGFDVLEISNDQKQQWEEIASMMQWVAPGFLHLFYKLLNAQDNPMVTSNYVPVFSREIPVAATDAVNIIFNPDTFFDRNRYKLANQVFITGHEVVHNMFGDCELLHSWVKQNFVLMPDGRKLPFDMDCVQRAMDARINALLIESKIGEAPKDGWFDKDVKGADSVYPIYERYLKKKKEGEGKPDDQPGSQPGGNRGGNQPGKPGDKPGKGGGFDVLLKPGEASGQDPHKVTSERSPEQWAVEIATAQTLEALRTQGNVPAALQRLFKQLLEPEVSWIDHIETLIMRQVGDGGIDWTTPNPWLGSTGAADYFVPSDTGLGAGWIVVWGDTSGSIGDKELAKNIGELAGLIDQVRPQRLTMIWCDAKLYDNSVVELDEGSDLRDLKPVGGGGTNYTPVLDWIAKNNRGEQPDLFIGFTDGFVSFPKGGHPFPTIWASSTKEGEVKYPFGQVVYINNLRRGA